MRALRRPGFSLLELMIVIVCLSIIALLALPSASETQVTRLRMAARLLVADLEFAQLQSIGDGADPCAVVFDAANHSYHLARKSDPPTPITNPATNMPYVTRFGQGRAQGLDDVEFDALSVEGDNQLGFIALGALDQGTEAVITLRCGTLTMQVRLDPSTGEPRIE